MDAKTLGEQPAFPEPGLVGLPNGEFIHPHAGMTLRQHYAGLAMQGQLSDPNVTSATVDEVAAACVEYADALLRALATNPT